MSYLKSKLTPEFLETLKEVGKLYGWSGDYIEVRQFIEHCFDVAGKYAGDLEPYEKFYEQHFDDYFDYYCVSSDSLVDRNKTMMLFLQKGIENHQYDILDKFINDDRVENLHLSLLKSILIMVENCKEISSAKVSKVFKQKMEQ